MTSTDLVIDRQSPWLIRALPFTPYSPSSKTWLKVKETPIKTRISPGMLKWICAVLNAETDRLKFIWRINLHVRAHARARVCNVGRAGVPVCRSSSLGRLSAIFIWRQILWFPVCFPAYQVPSEKESTPKGNNLLPRRANSLLLE